MPGKATLQDQFAIVTLAYDPDQTQVHVEGATHLGLSHELAEQHFPSVDSAIEQIEIKAKPRHLQVRFRLPTRDNNH